LDEARRALESFEGLSAKGVERLLSIYGGRAMDLIDLASAEPPLQKAIDAERTVLAAEVVFSIREEMARTGRCMSLSPQSRPMNSAGVTTNDSHK
jgi:glycerol-3-phosphate dehydrogenase